MFHSDVVVRQVDEVNFDIVEPLEYSGNTDRFTVPEGFRTDFASVPRAFVWLMPRYGTYTPAAILHDHLVAERLVSRRDADGLFRRAMRELGVSLPRRWGMWAAVRSASLMSGATPGEWAQFLLVAVLWVPFVAVPAVVVQVWLFAFWLIEGAFWVAGRCAGKRSAQPGHPART